MTIPPYGGDTLWTNLAVAYQGLSETMRGIVDGLRGIHRFQAPTDTVKSRAYDESVRRRELETEHPIVRVHPETGERLLFVSILPEVDRRAHSRWRASDADRLGTRRAPEYTVRSNGRGGHRHVGRNRATATWRDRHLDRTRLRSTDNTFSGGVPWRGR